VDTLMVVTRSFLQRAGGCDILFGLLDLVDPKPVRLRKFLSVFVNFWLFCNSMFDDCKQVAVHRA
jgi:hypothetical protein